jgi:hypothetical protein
MTCAVRGGRKAKNELFHQLNKNKMKSPNVSSASHSVLPSASMARQGTLLSSSLVLV